VRRRVSKWESVISRQRALRYIAQYCVIFITAKARVPLFRHVPRSAARLEQVPEHLVVKGLSMNATSGACNAFCEFAPVRVRHYHVCQQQLDRAADSDAICSASEVSVAYFEKLRETPPA
jgi:hypothetical protein